MAMTINDITLNSRLVRNKPGRWVVYSSFICLPLPNRMIKPQQSRKTIPIRSSQGNSGQRNFISVENTNEPRAAANAPFAVARL